MSVKLSQAQTDAVNQVMNETVAKFVNDLPQSITAKLHQAVIYAMGLEDSFGQWKVIKNEQTIITDLVKTKAAQLAAAMAPCVDEAVEMAKNDPEFRKQLVQTLAAEFRNKVQYALLSVISLKAKEAISAIVETTFGGENGRVGVGLVFGSIDPNDPKSFEGVVGERVLAILARAAAAGKTASATRKFSIQHGASRVIIDGAG